MTTLGEIFRRYGPAYRARFGRSLSPSQLQAMQAIEACRTAALGGHVYSCPACQITRYSYHSCRNRHCPTCQQDATQAWLAEQHALLLPVPYFLVTFTLPSELRAIARAHPETIYPLLFRTSAAALQQATPASGFTATKRTSDRRQTSTAFWSSPTDPISHGPHTMTLSILRTFPNAFGRSRITRVS